MNSPRSDVGLLSAADPRVLIWAIAQVVPVLTRDSEDFQDLLMAAGGHHPGILVVRPGIGSAITKLESSGFPIQDYIHRLNQWR